MQANVTGRYISAIQDTADTTRLAPKLYLDASIGFRPPVLDNRLLLTVGVNNVLDRDPPPCASCNNAAFDSSTYDTPGRFGFVRLSYRTR